MEKKVKIIGLLILIGTASVFGILFIPTLIDSFGPVPQFASHDWIELEKFGNVSKYHSTVGHGYPGDDNPTSDKHYFFQYDCFNDTTTNVSVYAPANVKVVKIEDETHVLVNGEKAGKQIHLQSIEHPSIIFVFFHQNIAVSGIQLWQVLNAGDLISHCDLRESVSTDIAVYRGLNTISWFQVLTATLMATYESRGITLQNIIKTDEQIAQSQADGYSFSNSDPADIVTLSGTSPCP